MEKTLARKYMRILRQYANVEIPYFMLFRMIHGSTHIYAHESIPYADKVCIDACNKRIERIKTILYSTEAQTEIDSLKDYEREIRMLKNYISQTISPMGIKYFTDEAIQAKTSIRKAFEYFLKVNASDDEAIEYAQHIVHTPSSVKWVD